MPPKKTGKTSQKLKLLYRISQIVGSDLSLSEVLNVIVSSAAELMQSRIVTILLYDEKSGTLNVAAIRSTQGVPPDIASVPTDKSVSGKAAKTGKPQFIKDVSILAPAIRGFAREQGIQSVLFMPMMLNGRAIGVINSFSQRSIGIDEEEMELFSLVASQAAIAVENARMCALKAAFRQLKTPS
jgi:GAF domain-containing protein